MIKADGQLFRIYTSQKDSASNLIHVYARHIFYDLLNYFIEDRRPTNTTCKQAMQIAMEGISKYTVGSNVTTLATQYIVRKNVAEALFMIVNRWQGEMVRDNYAIQIQKPKETSSGFLVQYGKNITGINEKINTDEVLTSIYPVGANALTLPEKYIISPLWNGTRYPDFTLVKMIDFKDAHDEATLRSEAQQYLNEHTEFDVNYQIDFIQLEETVEYKNYQSLLQVKVGDKVIVRHTLLGIDIQIKVISVEKDLLSAKNTKVELGKALYTLDQYMEEIEDKVDGTKDSMEDLQSQVDHTIDHVDTSIGDIQNHLNNMCASYAVVSNLSVGDGIIHVTYVVEQDGVTQYSAQYSYEADTSGKMTSIELENITSKLLLKEVATLTVNAKTFSIVYVDETEADYNYTVDSAGRITGISKVEGG